MAIKKYLDLTGLQAYDAKIKALIESADETTLTSAKSYADSLSVNYEPVGTATTKVQELANGQVATNTAAIAKLNGADTVEGSVAKAVKDAKTELEGKIGDLTGLDTTAKSDVVSAINEIMEAVGESETAGAVTVDTSSTTAGMAKSYTIKQGGATVATIDIPKDMVVSSGTVEVDPEDHDPGTYLVLTLANATNDKVYISVGSLVDIYTAQQSATKVQLTINPGTREISATLVAGSVTATELASNAVVTAKIADGNVTKAKLATNVQTSLGKADTALQAASITTGGANGTIAVGGTDVAVKGLGTSAYKTVGSAAGNVPEIGGALGTTQNVPIVTDSTGKLVAHASGQLKGAAFVEVSAFDSAGTASGLVTALQNGAVATNTQNITELDGRVDALETSFGNMDTYTAITEEEITALFA